MQYENTLNPKPIYDLFHILLSFWQTFGSMECIYVGG
jgi:hypothetical protein